MTAGRGFIRSVSHCHLRLCGAQGAVRRLWRRAALIQYVGGLSQLSSGTVLLIQEISVLISNADALKAYFDFTDAPNQKYQGTLSVEKRADNEYEIEFHDVSFRYPGTETDVLRHVSLKFNIGQKMAVVGRNGSGKTTMIKLLCRLYDPTEGFITLNGIDIRKYDYEDYLGIFSVAFQDFKLFSFSLGQNVAASVSYDAHRVQECLHKAGLEDRMDRMPKGLDTALYKDFDEDGVEISGGEAQKNRPCPGRFTKMRRSSFWMNPPPPWIPFPSLRSIPI